MATTTVDISERVPAQALMQRVLRDLLSVSPRTRVQRIFGVSPLPDACRRRLAGAVGELEVGRVLSTLPEGWAAFHSLPAGSDGPVVGHLVIGPAGVFTITTRHHRSAAIWVAGSTFRVAGRRAPYVDESEHAAERVTSLLRRRMPQLPSVRPLIALVSPGSLTFGSKPARVTVVRAERLPRWLARQPVTYTSCEVRAIIENVVEAGWQREPGPQERLEDRFAHVVRTVDSARRVRTVWSFAAVMSVLGGGAVAVHHVPSLLESMAQ